MEITVRYGYAASIVFIEGFNQAASDREGAFDWVRPQVTGDT